MTPRQRRAKPPRSQGRKRGSPSLSIHSIVARYVCIPFDEDTPVKVPSSAGRTGFSSHQKAVPVKNIPFAGKPSEQKRNIVRSFLPNPMKKGKNGDCFAIPLQVISRVPRQKRVSRSTELSKVFPGKKFAVGIILTWCFQSFAIAEVPRARVARRSFGRGATVPVDWGRFVTLVRAWDPERGSIEPPRRVSITSRPPISPEAARKGAAVVAWSRHGPVTSSRDFEFQGLP